MSDKYSKPRATTSYNQPTNLKSYKSQKNYGSSKNEKSSNPDRFSKSKAIEVKHDIKDKKREEISLKMAEQESIPQNNLTFCENKSTPKVTYEELR